MVVTRREAGKLVASGTAGLLLERRAPAGTKMIDSVVRGVQLGAQSYSFRDRPLNAAIKAYQDCRLGEAELWQGHLEPRDLARDALRQWRLNTPLSFFAQVRKKFDDAGVLLYAYNYSFTSDLSDQEIQRGFEIAKAMDVKYITSSGNVSVIPRVDHYAQQYRITVGNHGHDQTGNPDEFSSTATFAKAMQGASGYIAVNLDIGHFIAGDGDAVAYIKQHHDRIVTLHIKDRKKNHGPNVPFGQGETPIVQVLRLLCDNHWNIPANIEYEYGDAAHGFDTVAEVKKCFAYCRHALET
jgi:sugar phosphate isomerase/epimerase